MHIYHITHREDIEIQKRLSKVDELLFKRPWNKLSYIHKKQKIEEFIDGYLFEANNDNINKIKKQIFFDLKNKRLNSNKRVTYDPVTTVILNIENLKYNNETCEYSYK